MKNLEKIRRKGLKMSLYMIKASLTAASFKAMANE